MCRPPLEAAAPGTRETAPSSEHGKGEAFLCFVEAVEAIVAEEQRIYWRDRGDGPAASRAIPQGTPAGAQVGDSVERP